MNPPPTHHHHPYYAAVHQPYIPSTPAAATGASVYTLSPATPYPPSQAANPTTQFYPPPYPAVVAGAGASVYPLSSASNSATPYPPPQTTISTAQFYPPPYPTVAAAGASVYPLSSATPYPPPQTAIPTTQFHPPPHPTVAAVNHPRSHFVNRSIPRPDLAAVPISGEDYLRRLRNEVIFLHGLWHEGPPGSNPNSASAIDSPIGNFHLKPAPSTTFKKKKKKKNALPRPVSDKPWPVPPDSTAGSDSAWPAFRAIPAPPIKAVSEEEIARVWAIRVQKRALDAVQNFFAGKHGSESESGSDEDEDDESDDHGYLAGTFEGDEDLRSYYEKNWKKGEFFCLVCGGSGQKIGRKYKDCVALVQHTATISKTKKRVAHRAYGQVICKLLRWDIHNLPSVTEKPSNQQGDDSGKVEPGKDDIEGVVANTVPSVNENERSDLSKSCSGAGDDVATGKEEASELPSISEDPGAQRLNDSNNNSETADENPATVHNVHEQSDPSMGTPGPFDALPGREL